MTTLKPAQFADEGLTDWVWLVRGIEARYETGGFARGLELVNRIGAAAEEAGHLPDVTLTWPPVHVRLFSNDVAAITERDVASRSGRPYDGALVPDVGIPRRGPPA